MPWGPVDFRLNLDMDMARCMILNIMNFFLSLQFGIDSWHVISNVGFLFLILLLSLKL